MRFRKFLEFSSAGYFDDKEDTRPAGSGRQQEMPGTTMVMGAKEITGKVISKRDTENTVTLTVKSNDNDVADLQLPKGQNNEESPAVGDIIRAVYDVENNLQDYKVVHKFTDVSKGWMG